MLCDNLEENVACITWPLQLQQMPNSWYHVQHNQVRDKIPTYSVPQVKEYRSP